MNAPCYSLVLIEYYGYFMQEEINMFLSIFINDSCKHISAHDKVNNNQEKQYGGRGMAAILFSNQIVESLT